jgi:hypothetical protein
MATSLIEFGAEAGDLGHLINDFFMVRHGNSC